MPFLIISKCTRKQLQEAIEIHFNQSETSLQISELFKFSELEWSDHTFLRIRMQM